MTTDNEQMREALRGLLQYCAERDPGQGDPERDDPRVTAAGAALSAPARRVEAVALTEQQRAEAAWGYVEDSRNLSDRERGLMQSTERAIWAANNLAAPKE